MTSIIHIGCRIIILSIFSIAFSAVLCELQNFTIFYYSQYKNFSIFHFFLQHSTLSQSLFPLNFYFIGGVIHNSLLYNDVTLCVCVFVYIVSYYYLKLSLWNLLIWQLLTPATNVNVCCVLILGFFWLMIGCSFNSFS